MSSPGLSIDRFEEKDLSSEMEDDDKISELPDPSEVMRAKERDPMSFVSGFEGDDDGVALFDRPDTPGEKLLQAAEAGNVEVVRQLLEANSGLLAYTDEDGYTALHRACYEDNLEAATVLLAEGANVEAITNGDSWTPLHSACRWNAFRCVRLLLENGANVNARTNSGLTPLHVACNHPNTRETLIILLSEPGLDVDIRSDIGETAYEVAQRGGQLCYLFEMVRPSIRKI